MTTPTALAAGLSRDERGFTIVEMIISVAVLMVISGLMFDAVFQMTRANEDQENRSEMYAGIRNATALLQQEVGQAGRLTFPAPVSLASSVAGSTSPVWVTVTPSATNMFVGARLSAGNGPNQEVVEVTGVNAGTRQIQAVFSLSHSAGARVAPAGGFAEGIVPTTTVNGSSDTVLKIIGDINGDGSLVYVEYTCSWAQGRLLRNVMPYDAVSKPTPGIEQVLLDNLLPNPPDAESVVMPCFSYEQETINGRTYVTNVAVMTTVRTFERHPVTREFQVVTKALLNVAPRNVFYTWQAASFGYEERIQPLPPSVVNLLP